MKRSPEAWFLRYGRTDWNRAYRLQGQLDSRLTVQGIREAHQQIQIMPEVLARGPNLFCSPLGRARQTAHIALVAAVFNTYSQRMEINAGQLQGLLPENIRPARLGWAANAPAYLEIFESTEGDEGLVAFHGRVDTFLEDLTMPSVIVACGLLGQVLRAQLRGIVSAMASQMRNRQGVAYKVKNGVEQVLEMST